MADNAGQFIKMIFILFILQTKHLNVDLWDSTDIRRIIESGTISRLCFVFLNEAVILGAILCNLKEASIATRRNIKINQRIGYKKYGK